MAILHRLPLPSPPHLGRNESASLIEAAAPILPRRLAEWGRAAVRSASLLVGRPARLAAAADPQGLLDVEIPWLLSLLVDLDASVSLCHNDINAGNVLEPSAGCAVGSSGLPIMLVDFEYSGLNYRAFDLANTFCEMAADNNCAKFPGFAFTWDRYPSEAEQRAFIGHYLVAFHQGGDDPSEAEVATLLREVEALALASHLHWALWGIIVASKSSLGFGFLDYSLQVIRVLLFACICLLSPQTEPRSTCRVRGSV